MWNKKQKSLLMLVRVQKGTLKKFTIPLPLFVLDHTMQAIVDLLWLPDLFYPIWKGELQKHFRGRLPEMNLSQLMELVIRLIDELRQYGRWRMVEVEHEDKKVYIDFY